MLFRSPDFDGARLTLRHGLRFPRGHANIVVDGIWGFTEADGSPQGSTPLAVHRAAMLLVLRNIALLGNDDAFAACVKEVVRYSAHSAADARGIVRERSRMGLRTTSPIGVQLRVGPVQRRGLAALAAA